MDDFLAGMLQNPSQLRASADVVQPPDAVVLSAPFRNAEDDGSVHGVAEVRSAYDTPSKVSNASDSNLAAEVGNPW